MENATEVQLQNVGQVATDNLYEDYKVVYVLGGPGSGKGTQCSIIAALFGFAHLSVGDLLEREVVSGSENGAMIRAFKLEGKLLPSEIVVKILHEAIQASGTTRILIDGFPRNEENLAAAKNLMKIEPAFVLYLKCSEELMITRLLKRSKGRADDNMVTIPKRVKVFRESTLPVIDYYSSKGKVYEIDAEQSISDVFKKIGSLFNQSEMKDVDGNQHYIPQVPYKVVFVLGGPGSGKGTQCSKIAARFGYLHLSVGELLEKEVVSGSENGALIRSYKLEGNLLPSEIVIKTLYRAIEASKSTKFLIDGFPRNLENLAASKKVMKIEPDFVLYFECSEEVLTNRLLKRNEGRSDDNIVTIPKRIKVFHESTLPIIDYYRSQGKLYMVNAEQSIEEVFMEIENLFSQFELETSVVEKLPVRFEQLFDKLHMING